jgi:hypothetical protein
MKTAEFTLPTAIDGEYHDIHCVAQSLEPGEVYDIILLDMPDLTEAQASRIRIAVFDQHEEAILEHLS